MKRACREMLLLWCEADRLSFHSLRLCQQRHVLKRQKKYSEAMTAFREALAINPGMEAVKSAISEIERLEQGI
jgi:hypothetical protein